MVLTSVLSVLVSTVIISVAFVPFALRHVLCTLGNHTRRRTRQKYSLLLEQSDSEELEALADQTQSSPEDDWERIPPSVPSAGNGQNAAQQWRGVIGFFHPFCNAGGGGERVLWAGIRATQQQHPKAVCVVYTGDQAVDKAQMLAKVKERFDIELQPARIFFLYLNTRHYVLPSTWPHFTLLGQSLGSIVLAWDAFSLLVPDVFIDTMGYAFSLALAKYLFPHSITAAYVHYPTISTDMLSSLDASSSSGRGVNAGLGNGLKGSIKRRYWELFARLYSWAGGKVDFVMTNSSWTQDHMVKLWTASRIHNKRLSPIDVVFPPVAVEQMEAKIKVNEKTEHDRRPDVIFISQFRPEKNHQAVVAAFAQFARTSSSDSRLILVGSVRDDADSMLVYSLRVQAQELGIAERVVFVVNAPWSTVVEWLRTCSVGVNGMWNEHFGIGVVEYQAAGLIAVVNDSGGPKLDIIVDVDGQRTGYLASDADGFAAAFERALALSSTEALEMRLRARRNAKRFTEAEFERCWNPQVQKMIDATSSWD